MRYLARAQRSNLLLTGRGATLELRNNRGVDRLEMQWIASNPSPRVEAEAKLNSTTNYLLGNRRDQWRTGVANFGVVRYHEIYPGADLVFYGKDGELEYDLVLQPGAAPSRMRARFSGQQGLRITETGDLAISMTGGDIVQKRPRVYQDRLGVRTEVASSYRIESDGSVGIQLGDWDRARELVIDPVLSYATYLGGSGEELAPELAVDSAGNVYLFGDVASSNFPTTTGALRTTRAGGPYDNFITKFGPDGKVVWSTLLGGAGDETSGGIAVDATGSVYLTGGTTSSDFPVTPGAVQTTKRIGGDLNQDGYVVKLNPTGSALVYGTFYGGTDDETPTDIAINSAGEVFVTGFTWSTNYPTTPGALKVRDDAALYESFATRIDAAGASYVYSTYIGGTIAELAAAIAVDSQNNAYIAGTSVSTDFPVTTGAFQVNRQGVSDPFVLKLNPQGNAIVYSTLIGGGTGTDTLLDLAVDSAGNAYITGNAESSDFPLGTNPVQRTKQGTADAFLVKLNQLGSQIVYGTYLGGAGTERGESVAVDALGSAFVLLTTNSTTGLTPVQAFQGTNGGGADTYIVKLSTDGASVVGSSFFGGSGSELGRSIAVDNRDRAYISGSTQSTNLPVTPGSYQAAAAGAREAFWARVDFAAPAITLSVSPSSLTASGAVGTVIPSQQLSLVAATGQRPDWNLEVTTSGNWLAATPLSGSGSATIQVSFTTASLAAGTYNGTITLVNRSANTRTPIPVTLTITAGSTGGQLTSAGILSAASFQGGGIAPGLIVTIFGQKIGPDQLVSAEVGSDLKFPTLVAETRALFNNVAAPLIYVSAGQVSAIVPYSVVNATSVDVVMEYKGVRSNSVNVPLVASKPGLFTANASGSGQGAIQNQDLSVNSSSNPAPRGSIIVLYVTGEGATDPEGVDGLLATAVFPKPKQPVGVRIGGVDAEILYAGAAPSLVAGVMQVNVRIPDNVPDGPVPVQVLVGNAQSPAGVTVAVLGDQIGK